MAHSPRGWTGARTPSSIKRVRQTERRRAINQPRRSAAKTLVGKALTAVAANESAEDIQQVVRRAVSALDRAAKVGAIHRNAAARRKSRLMLKINAALGGEALAVGAKSARTTGRTAAAKQAKARIAASKATKAKGAQTAAGKARAALAKTSRDTTATATPEAPAETAAPTTRTRSTTVKVPSGTKTSVKASAKPATEPAAAKPRAAKATSKKS